MGRASRSSSPTEPAAGMPETDTVRLSRYVLQKDIDAAIKHLDDQQLDRLVTAVLEERGCRKKRLVPLHRGFDRLNLSLKVGCGRLCRKLQSAQHPSCLVRRECCPS